MNGKFKTIIQSISDDWANHVLFLTFGGISVVTLFSSMANTSQDNPFDLGLSFPLFCCSFFITAWSMPKFLYHLAPAYFIALIAPHLEWMQSNVISGATLAVLIFLCSTILFRKIHTSISSTLNERLNKISVLFVLIGVAVFVFHPYLHEQQPEHMDGVVYVRS